MFVGEGCPLAPARAPATMSNDKQIDFRVLINMFLIPQFTLPIYNARAAKGSLFFSLPMLINGLEQFPGETSRRCPHKGLAHERHCQPQPLVYSHSTWQSKTALLRSKSATAH